MMGESSAFRDTTRAAEIGRSEDFVHAVFAVAGDEYVIFSFKADDGVIGQDGPLAGLNGFLM